MRELGKGRLLTLMLQRLPQGSLLGQPGFCAYVWFLVLAVEHMVASLADWGQEGNRTGNRRGMRPKLFCQS